MHATRETLFNYFQNEHPPLRKAVKREKNFGVFTQGRGYDSQWFLCITYSAFSHILSSAFYGYSLGVTAGDLQNTSVHLSISAALLSLFWGFMLTTNDPNNDTNLIYPDT
jgi:hypothetical protein